MSGTPHPIVQVLLAAAVGIGSSGFATAAEPVAVAIAGFDFRDTSGEVRDQSAEHAKRLKALGVTLQEGLSGGKKTKAIPLTCRTDECTARTAGVEALSVRAKEAGARYLLIGEVHKMSTLIGQVKFALLDLSDNKPVCDRFLTYRGDTDEAWRRAAAFTARDVQRHCIP
ncbi:DUF3280 domain-containing protein (plasmid) [Phyllobacteriaceae bacterium JZ32]